MAFNTFLKFGGVNSGEDDQAIEVLSFSWGVTNPANGSSGSGAGAGKAQLSSLNVVKRMDSSSPVLFRTATTGRFLKDAVLYGRPVAESRSGAVAFFQYKLSDVLISSMQTTGSEHGDDAPLESISLNFSKIEFVTRAGDD